MFGNKVFIKFILMICFFLLCFINLFAQRNVVYVNIKYVNCLSTYDRWISAQDFDKLKHKDDTTIVIKINKNKLKHIIENSKIDSIHNQIDVRVKVLFSIKKNINYSIYLDSSGDFIMNNKIYLRNNELFLLLKDTLNTFECY